MEPKFLIVVLDGLRPDHVVDARMPNLSDFRRAGCWLGHHRATFPTETRVNAASLATGSPCAEHGIVGNRFIDRDYDPSRLINGADLTLLQAIDGTGPRGLTATPYSQVLAAKNLPMFSVGSQSSGSWGLSHPTPEASGHIGYWCREATRFTNNPKVASIAKRYPCIPGKQTPAAESCKRVADVFLELVGSEPLPPVSLVWFPEPDKSYHNYGLGSPEADDALMQADRQFGRLLEWWDAHRRKENLQLMVTSDHGHITIKEQISVKETLRRAGFSVGSCFEPGCDIALTGGRLGEIWIRDKDPVLAREVFDSLREQAWFGVGFSPGEDGRRGRIPGTFSHDSVFAAHPRAPDIRVTFVDDDEENAFGVPGSGYSDGSHPAGDSMHGGLHPRELGNVGLCGGSLFKEGRQSDAPTSIIDFAPTILHCLGIDAPATMTGRILHEVLAAGSEAPAPIEPCDLTITAGSRRSVIHRTRMGKHVYLDGAEFFDDGG